MSLLDDVDRDLDRLNTETTNLNTQVASIGTAKDNTKLRKRIAKSVTECHKLLTSIDDGLKSDAVGPDAKKKYRTEWQQCKKEVTQLETTFKKKEMQFPLSEERGSVSAADTGVGGTPVGGTAASAFDSSKVKQYDTSSLETEEAIQKEKLQGAVEIEEGMREVKEVYQEFGGLVKEQQTGLDSISSNVKVSRQRVEKGTEELKKASAIQKKSRGKMCLLGGIIVVILIIVIVVVVVLKK